MTKYITKENGHWRLSGKVKILLRECVAKESTRYSINSICVSDGKLASTDGWRLMEVSIENNIENGLYFCTSDGFLLEGQEGKFPKYEDIFPSKNKLKKIVDVRGKGKNTFALTLGELCRVGCIVRMELCLIPMQTLTEIITGGTKVFVARKNPAESPFYLEADTIIGHIRYIQMPVREVENKA